MNRTPSVMYGKDRIEYLHIIDGKILCGEDLVFKGESCKKCKHHAGITGTEPGRYVMCTRNVGLVLPPVVDLEEGYDPALKYVDGSDRDMFAYDQDELADMAQHLGAQVVGI